MAPVVVAFDEARVTHEVQQSAVQARFGSVCQDHAVIPMHGPAGAEPHGDAAQFARDLGTVWDFFASYETAAPVASFRCDDGLVGYAGDPEDLPGALLQFIKWYMEIPHAEWLHLVAQPHQSAEYDCRLALEGLDGPLILRFSDDSYLVFPVPVPVGPDTSPSRWEAGVASGLVQQELEAAVSLAQQAELVEALAGEDRRIAEALVRLLGELAKTEEPPRGLIRSSARWLGHKVDIFIEEAARTGGKAAGVVAVGAVGYQLNNHFPGLAHHLHHLMELADS